MKNAIKLLIKDVAFLSVFSKIGNREEEMKMTKPLKSHSYHAKSDAQLLYIIKDAGEAARAMRDVSYEAECKYLDQVNDASTIMNFRRGGGK